MKRISYIFNFDRQTIRDLTVFARKVLATALIVGAIDYAAGILLKWPVHPAQIVDQEKVDIYNAMLLDSKSYQVVAVGSSLTQSGFDPALFDQIFGGNAFNAGMGGESVIAKVLVRIKEVVPAKHPKLILYGIDSWGLNATSGPAVAQASRPQMLQFLQLFQRREDAKDWILGLRKGYSAFPPAFRRPEDTRMGRRFASYSGGTAMPDGWTDFRAIAKADFPSGLTNEFEPSPLQVKALQEIVDYLSANNVGLVLIQYPETQQEVDRNQDRHVGFENFIRSFSKERGLLFLDFDSEIPFPRDNINNFYDPNHLNENGALLYTAQLARLLLARCDNPGFSWCSSLAAHPR